MTPTTDTAITALLAADHSIPKATAIKALAVLRGDTTEDAALDKRISLAEAARLLGVCGKTVCRWADRGLIRRIGGENGTKARYSRNSVVEFLQGGSTAA